MKKADSFHMPRSWRLYRADVHTCYAITESDAAQRTPECRRLRQKVYNRLGILLWAHV